MGKLIQIDWSQAVNFDDTELFLYQLTDRQAMLLLGQTDYLAWKTRYKDLLIPESELIEIRDRINYQLMTPVEGGGMSCEDVEDCLETSVIVTNIENNITTIEGDVTNVTNTVNNHTTEINNLNENVNEIVENTVSNEFPDYPEPVQSFNAYCGSAWALANYFHDFIQDVITDAGTITFAEFVALIIQLQGFKFTIVKALWDFIIVNINPNLSTEVTDARQKVAEHIFCNELDMAQARADIIADGTITSDAEATYVSAIDALTDAKLNELVYLGSLDESQDCSGLGCGCAFYDFTVSLHGFNLTAGTFVAGQGIRGVSTAQTHYDLIIPVMPNTFDFNRIYVELLWVSGKGNFSHFTPTPIRNGTQLNVGGINLGNPPANTAWVRSSFITADDCNGLRLRGNNSGSASYVYLRKLWIEYTKVTGSPQYGAPECYP